MSLFMGPAFAALGLLAFAAILSSVRHSLPLVAELRTALKQPVPPEELRLTMRETVLLPCDPERVQPRSLQQPRPIARLRQARSYAVQLT